MKPTSTDLQSPKRIQHTYKLITYFHVFTLSFQKQTAPITALQRYPYLAKKYEHEYETNSKTLNLKDFTFGSFKCEKNS